MTHDNVELPTKMRDAVSAHWKAFLIEGILLVIFGLAAMIVPPAASLAVTILLGWLFLISGIAGLALTFWAREMPGFWWSLISSPKVSPPSCMRWSIGANCRAGGHGC